ncbi:MAG: orotidine-5'-phosphate decarboxylase [candidate division WS1 bacterium]|nr:orotidine-5'-phosphate decarboxylase [candidate division WS1 bacterium]
MAGFGARLAGRMRATDSRVVIGLDPHMGRIREIPRFAAMSDPDAAREFCLGILEGCHDLACAVKPQVAFFERWGAPGWEALVAVVAAAREHGLPVILDAKRGDIGSTASAYATHLDPAGPIGADALTVNAYLGGDAMEPFLEACDRWGAGLFVLVKTSNPGSSDLQDLRLADGRRVCEAMADLVAAWSEGREASDPWGPVGAVVGATHPQDVAALRQRMPRSILLLPGVGAQGGDPAKLRSAFGDDGLGACVNSSRSLLYAWEAADLPPERFVEATRLAAESLRAQLA